MLACFVLVEKLKLGFSRLAQLAPGFRVLELIIDSLITDYFRTIPLRPLTGDV